MGEQKMQALKKINRELRVNDFLDELSKNAWFFFSLCSIILVRIFDWLVEFTEINHGQTWKWTWGNPDTSYFIHLPSILFILAYIIFRLRRIRTHRQLTALHFFMFIVSLFLYELYIIDFSFIAVFSFLTFSVFVFNLCKSEILKLKF